MKQDKKERAENVDKFCTAIQKATAGILRGDKGVENGEKLLLLFSKLGHANIKAKAIDDTDKEEIEEVRAHNPKNPKGEWIEADGLY